MSSDETRRYILTFGSCACVGGHPGTGGFPADCAKGRALESLASALSPGGMGREGLLAEVARLRTALKEIRDRGTMEDADTRIAAIALAPASDRLVAEALVGKLGRTTNGLEESAVLRELAAWQAAVEALAAAPQQPPVVVPFAAGTVIVREAERYRAPCMGCMKTYPENAPPCNAWLCTDCCAALRRGRESAPAPAVLPVETSPCRCRRCAPCKRPESDDGIGLCDECLRDPKCPAYPPPVQPDAPTETQTRVLDLGDGRVPVVASVTVPAAPAAVQPIEKPGETSLLATMREASAELKRRGVTVDSREWTAVQPTMGERAVETETQIHYQCECGCGNMAVRPTLPARKSPEELAREWLESRFGTIGNGQANEGDVMSLAILLTADRRGAE